MKRIVLLLLLTTPLFAQSSLTFFGTSQRNGGSSRFPDATRDLRTEFDSGSGFGAAYARRFGRFSGEAALFRLGSGARIRERGAGSQRMGDVDMTTVSAMARIHLRPGAPFDVYAGAGAVWALVDDLRNDDVGRVPIDADVTPTLGAGLTYDFARRAGMVLDARYLPLSLRANVEGETINADMNPLLLSIGLRLRF
jgi:opacity protein-like surface antigen